MHDIVENIFAAIQKGLTALSAFVAQGSTLFRKELKEAGLGEAGQNVAMILLVGALLLLAFRILGTALSLILALVLLLLLAEAYFPQFGATMKHSIG